MGKVIKQNREVINDVIQVTDTADGFIRVERTGGYALFIRKAEIAEVDAVINYGIAHPFGVLKRKLGERKRQKIEQQEQVHLEEVAMITRELLCIDQKSDQCHCCGNKKSLTRFPFGLAKILSEKRTWGMTCLSLSVSAAMAAVFIPLAAPVRVGIRLPGEKRLCRILRLNLVLCSNCLANQKSICRQLGIKVVWLAHPWWHKAMECGYTEFIPEDELCEWKSI